MTKRRLFWIAALAGCAVFGIWLEPTRVVWGWLRGEAFYEGRPTSYWRAELDRWNVDFQNWGGFEVWTRRQSWVDRVREWWNDEMVFNSEARPAILQGDSAAETVLEALQHDASSRIREHAELGLKAIRADRALHNFSG